MKTANVEAEREAYRSTFQTFLKEAPGGEYYNVDSFDLGAYRARCLALKRPHEAAKVSLAGTPSVHEDSWLWCDSKFLMFMMSPLNLTRLREAAEQYEKAVS